MNRLRQRYENEHDGEVLDLEGEPTITPILKSAEGGIPRILEALRAHDDDDARSFIELYDSLTAVDRKHLTLEEVSAAAGIGSLRLAEVATSAMILHGQMEAKLCLASSMGKVVKSVVKAATDEIPIMATIGEKSVQIGKTNGDVKAMELFGKMTKLVPVPKGVQVNFGPLSDKDQDESNTPEPIYLDPGQRLKAIHDAVEQRRLPAPPSEPVLIHGRLDNIQAEVAEILVEREAD